MTSKLFVMNDGSELSPEETIQKLLQQVSENSNSILTLQSEINHLIIRLNEHTQEHV